MGDVAKLKTIELVPAEHVEKAREVITCARQVARANPWFNRSGVRIMRTSDFEGTLTLIEQVLAGEEI